jgi:hypothetical protein
MKQPRAEELDALLHAHAERRHKEGLALLDAYIAFWRRVKTCETCMAPDVALDQVCRHAREYALLERRTEAFMLVDST